MFLPVISKGADNRTRCDTAHAGALQPCYSTHQPQTVQGQDFPRISVNFSNFLGFNVFLADVHLQPASGCYGSFCSHKSLICPNIVVYVKCKKEKEVFEEDVQNVSAAKK